MSFTLLQTAEISKSCHKDMTTMFSSFYQAKKDKRLKHSEIAKEGFYKSIDAAYKALESCQDAPQYDFNIMYNFIMASQREL
jgi:hypothetical protein